MDGFQRKINQNSADFGHFRARAKICIFSWLFSIVHFLASSLSLSTIKCLLNIFKKKSAPQVQNLVNEENCAKNMVIFNKNLFLVSCMPFFMNMTKSHYILKWSLERGGQSLWSLVWPKKVHFGHKWLPMKNLPKNADFDCWEQEPKINFSHNISICNISGQIPKILLNMQNKSAPQVQNLVK